MATVPSTTHYGFKVLIFFLLGLQVEGTPCTGQTLGAPTRTLTGVTAGTNSGFSTILLDPSMAASCCGVISEYNFVTKAAGTITLQVWRETTAPEYRVLGEKAVTVTSDSTQTVTLTAAEQTSIEPGDFIGWHSSGLDIIPYIATGSAVMGRVTQGGGKKAVGGTANWSGPVNGEQYMIAATLSAGTAPDFGSSLPATVTAQTTDPVGTVLHTLTPTDANPDDIAGLTVSIVPTSTNFEYDDTSKEVRILSAPLAAGTHTVVFEVVDRCSLTGTGTLTINVADTKPNITSLPIAAALLEEEQSTPSLLHTLVYTDDGPLTDVTCNMTPSGIPFQLKYITGTTDYGIYFEPDSSNPLNYATTPLYQMFVICNDGALDSDQREFQVSIDPNQDPVLTLNTITVDAETTPNGTVVSTIAATDPENDNLTYSMNCTCPFAMLPNGDIYATEDLDTHKVPSYTIDVTVSDGFNNVTQSTTITIDNINTAPNITTPSGTTQTVFIQEHTDEGLPNLIGTVTDIFQTAATDADADTLTYSFEFFNGIGEDLFDFNNMTGEIKTKTDLDYEELNADGTLQTVVYVRAHDGREFSDVRTITLSVLDVNETPEFARLEYAIETTETTSTTTLPCAFFDIRDEDIFDTTDYAMDCGSVTNFQIENGNAGCDAYIVQNAEYDLDSPGAVSEDVVCALTVFDKSQNTADELTSTATLTITVLAEDDNWPELTQTSYQFTLSNDTTVNARFGNADATDDDFVDDHKRHTYTTSSSDFSVTREGVFVSKRDWTSENAPLSRTFTLTVTDEAGHTDTAPVVVDFVDVVTTTAATTTASSSSSSDSSSNNSSFLDENLAWLIPAILLGLAALGLLGFMLYRFFSKPGRCVRFGRGFRRGPRPIRGGFRGGLRGGMVQKAVAQPQLKKRLVYKKTAVLNMRQTTVQRQFAGGTVQTAQQPMIGSTPAQVPPTQPIQTPPPTITQPPPDTAPPKKSSSIFDCFKNKNSAPDPDPQPAPPPKVPQPLDANEYKPFTF